MEWTSFENGATIGQTGSESGVVLRDCEHPLGARITLEEAGRVAPYAITCGIYGGMVHTRFFSTEREASQEFERMSSALAEVLQTTGGDESMIDAIDRFVERFP